MKYILAANSVPPGTSLPPGGKGLALPGGHYLNPPIGVPSGGLEAGGAGGKLINLGIQLIFTVGIILALIFIIYSGIQWITSGGDEKKIEAARGRLVYSIIGLVILLSSFLIVATVINILGGDVSLLLNTPLNTP